jgi:hypothetical protein
VIIFNQKQMNHTRQLNTTIKMIPGQFKWLNCIRMFLNIIYFKDLFF